MQPVFMTHPDLAIDSGNTGLLFNSISFFYSTQLNTSKQQIDEDAFAINGI